MKEIMPRVRREWVDQILVLDGGSTGRHRTSTRASRATTSTCSASRGIRQGYDEVLPLINGDVILTFSPDGNSIPELIPELVAKMNEGYDMVIASRYPRGEQRGRRLVTAFGNWLFTRTVNVLYRGALHRRRW